VNKSGKLVEILVKEDCKGIYKIWADEGKKDIIKKVEGVVNVYNITSQVEYSVHLDPRYDDLRVIRNIIDALVSKG
jgi:hypothetical protein